MRIDFYGGPELFRGTGNWKSWATATSSSLDPYAFFHSPLWWHHLLAESQDFRVGFCVGCQNEAVGVVPVIERDWPLSFRIGSGYSLGACALRVAQIPGGHPLIPDVENALSDVVLAILEAFPRCDGVITQFGLPIASQFWNAATKRGLMRDVIVRVGEESCRFALISVQGSYEEYLSRFSSKTRWNFKRRVRQLREYGGGALELECIEKATEVERFVELVDEMARVSRGSIATGWSITSVHERQKMLWAAEDGLLRAYVLKVGGVGRAFVLGYQNENTYFYDHVGYDPAVSQMSPGTVLLYMLLEDLFSRRSPMIVNLGEGEYSYKDQFATDRPVAKNVFFGRPKIGVRGKLALHSAFRGIVGYGNSLLGRNGQKPPSDSGPIGSSE